MENAFPLIVITPQEFVEGEIAAVKALFEAGLECLHVRKAGKTEAEVRAFIGQLPVEYYDRIMVHYYPSIADDLKLRGTHFKYADFEERTGTTSVAIHNWEEYKLVNGKADYVFISPVFDSISKGSYRSNPDLLTIPHVERKTKLIALGGISEETIDSAKEIGYDGVAVLGYIWNEPDKSLARFMKLKQACKAVTA